MTHTKLNTTHYNVECNLNVSWVQIKKDLDLEEAKRTILRNQTLDKTINITGREYRIVRVETKRTVISTTQK